jgi:hypothetical protein
LTATGTAGGSNDPEGVRYRPGRDETRPLLELVDQPGALDGTETGGIQMRAQSPTTMVAELVAAGVSRLTAERTVEIQQGEAEPGRARRHTAGKK